MLLVTQTTRKICTQLQLKLLTATLNAGQRKQKLYLTGKLTVQAADAHAGDTYYHIQCYLHLRDLARSANRQTLSSSTPPPRKYLEIPFSFEFRSSHRKVRATRRFVLCSASKVSSSRESDYQS